MYTRLVCYIYMYHSIVLYNLIYWIIMYKLKFKIILNGAGKNIFYFIHMICSFPSAFLPPNGSSTCKYMSTKLIKYFIFWEVCFYILVFCDSSRDEIGFEMQLKSWKFFFLSVSQEPLELIRQYYPLETCFLNLYLLLFLELIYYVYLITR